MLNKLFKAIDSTDNAAPGVTSVALTDVVINDRPVVERSGFFLGLDTSQMEENLAGLKRMKFLITNDESVKPYANLEIRLMYPPTMAMKEVVDYSYPARLLTKDKQFVKNMSGKLW